MAVDKDGNEFDPEVHLSDDNGPVLNDDGTLRKMNAGQKRAHSGHKTRRRRRKEFGPNYRLAAEKRPGFVRRWVNDIRGRIEQFTVQNDWEPVKDETGKVTRRAVGKGEEAVLLEIPEDYYREDQAEKRRNVPDPSKIAEARAGHGEYIPDGGDSALR